MKLRYPILKRVIFLAWKHFLKIYWNRGKTILLRIVYNFQSKFLFNSSTICASPADSTTDRWTLLVAIKTLSRPWVGTQGLLYGLGTPRWFISNNVNVSFHSRFNEHPNKSVQVDTLCKNEQQWSAKTRMKTCLRQAFLQQKSHKKRTEE